MKRCTYCHEPIEPGNEIYLDESGVDGVFCDENHAELFIMNAVETIANEPN
jgi:ribosomal protein L24E